MTKTQWDNSLDYNHLSQLAQELLNEALPDLSEEELLYTFIEAVVWLISAISMKQGVDADEILSEVADMIIDGAYARLEMEDA